MKSSRTDVLVIVPLFAIVARDDKQVEWMRAYTNSINKLKDFVAAYHLTGLTWNPQVSVKLFFLVDTLEPGYDFMDLLYTLSKESALTEVGYTALTSSIFHKLAGKLLLVVCVLHKTSILHFIFIFIYSFIYVCILFQE